MISAMGADSRADDSGSDPVFAAYLRAKKAADDAVRGRRELDTTIVRPGLLTDDAGTGRVTVAETTGRGSVPRRDVAAVVAEVLDSPATAGHTFELVGGDTEVRAAVAALIK